VPSRVKKVRNAASAAASQPGVSQPAPSQGAASQPSGRLGTGAPAGNAAPAAPEQALSSIQTSRRSLKNWRVRSRLILLITIPTLTAVVLGGSYVVTSAQNVLAYQRIEQLSNLSYSVTNLASHLENERDWTLQYIGQGDAGRPGWLSGKAGQANAAANLALVTDAQKETGPWIQQVSSNIAPIGSAYPEEVQGAAQNIGDLLKTIKQLRVSSTQTQLPVTVVAAKYTSLIDQLLDIDDDISLGSGDPTLNNDVRALNLVSLIAEQASEQRGLLAYAFAQDGTFDPTVLQAVVTAQDEQAANVAEFNRVATTQQVAEYDNTVSGALVDFASEYEQQAIDYGQQGLPLSLTEATSNQWFGDMGSGTIGYIHDVEANLVAATIARATTLRKNAILTLSIVGVAVLVVLALALILTTVVGRSMVRPLRRLRSGALEVAGVRLPETVRRMSDSDGAGVALDVEPIDVDSSDEIGEVARAFDQVHREALRLASNEAALRGNVNAMFVNLSRRSQSLVERQIRLIDDLEQGEQDPDRLSSLFQMDHLATRMRRNSENLLVLAGHDATRRWNQPVSLVDVLRAAVSEIEQYERVTLNVQPGIAVRGHAVNDVVHLLAELAENATSFSSAETPVVVAGHLLSSGGVLLDITDQGVGMGAEEMAHANWRLDNPPVVDVAVSRRMGLFVVARLAARHGIRVRLRPAAAGGLTALVWLPDEVVSHETPAGTPGMRRFDPSSVAATQVPLALPSGGNGGAAGMDSAEREINAAREPKFASAVQAEGGAELSGLGPRRVPGAGLHPGNAPWGGAASTSPLPAIGPDSVPEDFAVAAAGDSGLHAAPASGYAEPALADSAFGDGQDSSFRGFSFDGPSGDDRGADLSGPAGDFTSAASSHSGAQSVTLGPPSVVGQAGGTGERAAQGGNGAAPSDSGTNGGRGGFDWDSAGSPAFSGPAPVVTPPGSGGTGLSGSGENGSAGPGPAGSGSTGPGSSGSGSAGSGSDALTSGSGVVVPPAESNGLEHRLPIFEAVESDWFRRGRSGVGSGWSGSQPENGGASPAAAPEVAWSTPSDQGWQAAAAASSPATGGTTTAGLPKRVPQANLVPGAVSSEQSAPPPVPARSAAATRDRFASFQRGIREGRAALGGDEAGSEGEDASR
jgi:signal transduction histidine kinase